MLFYQSEEQNREKMANTACTGRWGLLLRSVRDLQAFSGFGFFLLSNIIHARPHAGNANRSAAS